MAKRRKSLRSFFSKFNTYPGKALPIKPVVKTTHSHLFLAKKLSDHWLLHVTLFCTNMKQWCVHFYTNRKIHFKTKIKFIYRHHIYYLNRNLYFLLGLTLANGVGSDLVAEMCIAKEITQESLPDMSYGPTTELLSFWWTFLSELDCLILAWLGSLPRTTALLWWLR